MAVFAGIFVTPAILTVLPLPDLKETANGSVGFARLGNWLLTYGRQVTVVSTLLAVVCTLGLYRLETKIDPLDFLPKSGKVLARLTMPEGVAVSGLESDGADLFYAGGGSSGKVRAVRRPKRMR